MEPFDIDMTSDDVSLTYTIHPRNVKGYAAKLVKKISIQDTALTIDYELCNEGSQRIDTEEYIHNFIGINEELVGPAYKLKLPVPVRFTEVESDYTSDLLSVQDCEIGWNARPSKPFTEEYKALTARVSLFMGANAHCQQGGSKGDQ